MFEEVSFKTKNGEKIQIKYGYSFTLGIVKVVAFAASLGNIFFTANDLHIIRCLINSFLLKKGI
jgi:hypothetical protein